MVQISAGKFKGRKLHIPGSARPTADKVRQALFNILGNIEGKIFLDLFAGSGAVGVEAASRGAEVVFNDLRSAQCISENLKIINLQALVLRLPWQKAVEVINRKFDIIFLDPPYDFVNYARIVEAVKPLLNDQGIIVIECQKKQMIEIEHFSAREYIYNDTKLMVLEAL